MILRAALAYRLLTAGALGAAALGLVLPVLPTTPFVLLAAWSASRHSPELAARLQAHPRFGPPLLAWRNERALPRRAKLMACAMLAASLTVTLLTVEAAAVQIGVAALLTGVAAYLVTRPEPSGDGSGRS